MTKEFCPKNYINTNCTFECSCEECPITQNDVNVNIKQIHKMDNAKEKFELCDCGQIAKWLYVPGFKNNSNPFFCDDRVPRGCDCNYIYEANFTSKEEYEIEKQSFDNIVEKIDSKGLKYFIPLDEHNREYPCCEYMFNGDGFEKD